MPCMANSSAHKGGPPASLCHSLHPSIGLALVEWNAVKDVGCLECVRVRLPSQYILPSQYSGSELSTSDRGRQRKGKITMNSILLSCISAKSLALPSTAFPSYDTATTLLVPPFCKEPERLLLHKALVVDVCHRYQRPLPACVRLVRQVLLPHPHVHRTSLGDYVAGQSLLLVKQSSISSRMSQLQ